MLPAIIDWGFCSAFSPASPPGSPSAWSNRFAPNKKPRSGIAWAFCDNLKVRLRSPCHPLTSPGEGANSIPGGMVLPSFPLRPPAPSLHLPGLSALFPLPSPRLWAVRSPFPAPVGLPVSRSLFQELETAPVFPLLSPPVAPLWVFRLLSLPAAPALGFSIPLSAGGVGPTPLSAGCAGLGFSTAFSARLWVFDLPFCLRPNLGLFNFLCRSLEVPLSFPPRSPGWRPWGFSTPFSNSHRFWLFDFPLPRLSPFRASPFPFFPDRLTRLSHCPRFRRPLSNLHVHFPRRSARPHDRALLLPD